MQVFRDRAIDTYIELYYSLYSEVLRSAALGNTRGTGKRNRCVRADTRRTDYVKRKVKNRKRTVLLAMLSAPCRGLYLFPSA